MVFLNSDSGMKCSRCGKESMVTDSITAERFCGVCGFVITECVHDLSTEWRSFSKEEFDDKTRTGSPASLAVHDMGLATMIGHENSDSSGKPLSASMKGMINRLRTWDSRSRSHESVDRNLMHAFSELGRLKDKLALSDAVIEKTAYVYRKAQEKGLSKGRSIPGLLAASLYLACRDSETPRTLNEVSKKINLKRTDVSRCYRLLLKELDLQMPVQDPIKCMSRIASKAGIGEKAKRGALAILENAADMEITAGKDPMGLAAAALYLSSVINGNYVTQKIIAQAAEVTEVTIRNRCKGLKDSLKLCTMSQ